MANVPKPVVLAVLDGFGVSSEPRGNAVIAAAPPHLDDIEANFPFVTLQASGVAVGLPWGEPGNSEVGHLTMGAGRALYHHLPRIIVAIHDGSFFKNLAFQKVIAHVRERKSALHIIGLTSSGSVHSYADHLYALLELATQSELPQTWLHCITDGRDAPRQEAEKFIARLEERLAVRHPTVAIASLIGRFFAMDRDGQWERIKKAYDLLTGSSGAAFQDPIEYIERSYAAGAADEFLEPAWREQNGNAVGRIAPGDGIIFFNFREDSMREITQAFATPAFDAFGRERIGDLAIATMTEYEPNLHGVEAAFPPLEIHWPLARVLSVTEKSQLHIAETEKYAHVTYFFNGGREQPFPHEDRILVPSLSVPHFDDRPEMSAKEIVDKVIENLGHYDFILANLANADMVGHTGNFGSIVKAVEILDEQVGKLMAAVLDRNGALVITGDHGNAEQKVHPFSGEAITAHTTSPVPLYLVANDRRLKTPHTKEEISAKKREPAGILIDVAPTIIALMDLPKPDEMTGKSLLPVLS